MAYTYEQAGSQRFNELCIALLEPDYAQLQLIDLGPPDSSRYGFERFPDVADKVVLQVAFELDTSEDAAARVIATLESELPKIRELDRREAQRYIFATNLARPEVRDEAGNDVVQGWLAEHCPVPALCLWRADVDRRLDWAAPTIGLAFPEVLDRKGAIEGLVATMVGPECVGTLAALVEFVESVFRRNLAISRKVFVDIPIADAVDAGAAAVLLSDASPAPQWRLLRGEGGSGKSSVINFVTTVHAARLLDDRAYLAGLDAQHTRTPFRVPLVIDAREFAAQVTEVPGRAPERVLENFIGTLLTGSSQSSPAAANVRSLLRALPWFIALDQLDEVDDSETSERVASTVVQAAATLRRLGADIHVVVAIRPSRLGSISLVDRAMLEPLNLGWLDAAQRNRLSEQVIAISGRTGTRAEAARELIASLDASVAFTDVMGNPLCMRLVLDLVLAGELAIPDRPAQLFEAHERMTINSDELTLSDLKEHTFLVGEFTRFLGWILEGFDVGAHAIDRRTQSLEELAEEFVDARAYPSRTSQPLVAAVRRLTYLETSLAGLPRFRDQSVREYLSAQYLVRRQPAVVHQALDALFNSDRSHGVARFVAGLWNEGDLDALVLAVTDAIGSEDFTFAFQARRLGHSIVVDRVLRSRPLLLRSLIEVLFDEVGVELMVRGSSAARYNGFAADCARDTVRDVLVRRYIHHDGGRMPHSAAELLRHNDGALLSAELAAHCASATGSIRTERFTSLLAVSAHENLNESELESLVYDDNPDAKQLYLRLTGLLESGTSVFSESPRMAADLIAQLLARGVTKSVDVTSRIAAFATVVADGKNTAAMIEGLAVARDYDSAAIAIEAIRAEFGDSWATFALAAAACGIPRHSGVRSSHLSLLDPALPLCDRALSARMWRGRSEWWSEQLARANTVQERMFWAVVLVAWGNSKFVSDHVHLLDATLASLHSEDYFLVIAATRAALAARDAHGGRARPTFELPTGSSARGAVLISIALDPTQLQSIDLSGVDPALARFVTGLHVADRLGEFSSWTGMPAAEALEWCELFVRANELQSDVPPVVLARLVASDLPRVVVERVLRSPGKYPQSIVWAAIDSAEFVRPVFR